MATAFSPVRSDYESDVVGVVHAPAPRHVEKIEPIRIISERQIYFVQVFDNPLTRKDAIRQSRLQRLRVHRALWGIISILCLGYLCVSFGLSIPYEPAAALLSCSLGLFAVFLMKIADAQR